jgi:hypothetical protein
MQWHYSSDADRPRRRCAPYSPAITRLDLVCVLHKTRLRTLPYVPHQELIRSDQRGKSCTLWGSITQSRCVTCGVTVGWWLSC